MQQREREVVEFRGASKLDARILVQRVVQEGEAEAGRWVHPTQLPARAGVAECARRGWHPAVKVETVVSRDIAGDRAAGRNSVRHADTAVANGAHGVFEPRVGKCCAQRELGGGDVFRLDFLLDALGEGVRASSGEGGHEFVQYVVRGYR